MAKIKIINSLNLADPSVPWEGLTGSDPLAGTEGSGESVDKYKSGRLLVDC